MDRERLGRSFMKEKSRKAFEKLVGTVRNRVRVRYDGKCRVAYRRTTFVARYQVTGKITSRPHCAGVAESSRLFLARSCACPNVIREIAKLSSTILSCRHLAFNWHFHFACILPPRWKRTRNDRHKNLLDGEIPKQF